MEVGVVNLSLDDDTQALRTCPTPQLESFICANELELRERIATWFERDIHRGFAPGDCLFRAALIRTSGTTSILSSWHAAVLDGWSTASLNCFLQDSYAAVGGPNDAPLRPGSHIDDYRFWSARAAQPLVTGWASYLSGASFPAVRPARAVRRTSRLCALGPLKAEAASSGASAVARLIAEVASAAQKVFGLPSNEPIGVRIGVRPPEIERSMQMIGQVTVDVPMRLDLVADCDHDSDSLARQVQDVFKRA